MPEASLLPGRAIPDARKPWLTRREKQVFDLIYVDVLTSYDVAAELDISSRTVFNDLASIRKKNT